MSQLESYLFFDGNCADAMLFYEKTLGGTIEMMLTHAQAPDQSQMPPGSEDRIMHARLNLQGSALLASDWMVGEHYPGMQGFSLALSYPTVDEAQRIFNALADGGLVKMAFQETFWAKGFGMLTDKFGTPWMINGTPMKPQQ